MREGPESQNEKQQSREGKTHDDRHHTQKRVCFQMYFGRAFTFEWFRQIGKKQSTLPAVSLRRLVGFSASRTEHIVYNDYHTGKVYAEVYTFHDVTLYICAPRSDNSLLNIPKLDLAK